MGTTFPRVFCSTTLESWNHATLVLLSVEVVDSIRSSVLASALPDRVVRSVRGVHPLHHRVGRVPGLGAGESV